jgi:twitching motility protein PilT
VVSLRLVPRADGQTRVPAVEVMVSTPFIRDCIVNEEKTRLIQGAIAQGTTEGMQTFVQALFDLCPEGLITRDEAARRCTNPDEFRMMLSGVDTGTRGSGMGSNLDLE